MESSRGEKIMITLLSLVMLGSIAMLTYRLIVVSPNNRTIEASLTKS
ncbi:MAG: hypothetical protein HC827_04840 [Cyanobacteria bacterium RM1_2_2]|nr:hypothetical protein [Cyanobacteria bacterium RM1_2_2]